MSMSEPLTPHGDDDHPTPAAADPGTGAPGTPLDEEPDILPDTESVDDEQSLNNKALKDTPFRSPEPGKSLTADQLEDRI
jgi:hypothetical protein